MAFSGNPLFNGSNAYTSCVAVPLQNAPRGVPTPELETHEKSALLRLLAVNDFAMQGRSLVDRNNLYRVPWPPTMGGAHAKASRAEIIRVGFFFDFFAGHGCQSGEAHHHHDGESLFRSSCQISVEMHTVTCRAVYC